MIRRRFSLSHPLSAEWRERFSWLPPHLFTPDLAEHLRQDAEALIAILTRVGPWDPGGISPFQERAGRELARREDRRYDAYGAATSAD